jgi:hypothetical protein
MINHANGQLKGEPIVYTNGRSNVSLFLQNRSKIDAVESADGFLEVGFFGEEAVGPIVELLLSDGLN